MQYLAGNLTKDLLRAEIANPLKINITPNGHSQQQSFQIRILVIQQAQRLMQNVTVLFFGRNTVRFGALFQTLNEFFLKTADDKLGM